MPASHATPVISPSRVGRAYVMSASAKMKMAPRWPPSPENLRMRYTPAKPKPTPNSAPKPTCEKSMPTISPADMELPEMPYCAAMTAVNTTVSMYDIGSFEPDSISSMDEVPYFKFSLRERRILKTDAASVEQMTEPMSMLSAQPMPPSKKGSSRKT